VTNVAEKFNVSEVYIRRIFKERFSMTPKEYLQRLRIDYARKLLSYGCISISEVAAKSGFNDEKYFSSAFKKDVGKSPSAYAKNKG
jgi:AraC-like DNA-binding protein